MFLTSNNTRDLSEALKRRCLYLHLGYPSVEREAEIVQLHVPELSVHLAREIAGLVAVLRSADLKKPPSISESVDWARTLLALGAAELTDDGDPADPVGAAEVRAGYHRRARRAVAGLSQCRARMPRSARSSTSCAGVGVGVSVGEHLDAARALASDSAARTSRSSGRRCNAP